MGKIHKRSRTIRDPTLQSNQRTLKSTSTQYKHIHTSVKTSNNNIHKHKYKMNAMKMNGMKSAMRGAPLKVRANVRVSRSLSVRQPMRVFAEAEKPEAPEAAAPPPPKSVSFGEAMAFSGAAPEAINGRLAMLGFVAALGAEASSGETVFQQVGDATAPIAFAFVLFAAASLIPILKGVKKEKLAFFTPEAELLNGRAAMIGFALLLAIEAKSHAAFF